MDQGPKGPGREDGMKNTRELAERFHKIAGWLDPFDYECTPDDHMKILEEEPEQIIEYLMDALEIELGLD